MPVPPATPPKPPASRSDASARDAEGGTELRPRFSSEAIFGRATEVLIEHQGALYRLRRTALGKLILTK